MIEKELFISKTLNAVFNTNLKNILETGYFSGNLENIYIAENAYQVLDNYLKNNHFDLEILIGGLSLLAYGHIQNNINSNLIEYIKKHSIEILSFIDTTIPNLKESFNDINVQYYKNLLKQNFSYKLLCELDYPHFPQLTNRHYWGIQYLFLFIISTAPDNFETWYLKTKREDLKLYFIATLLEPRNIINSLNKKFALITIQWFKALHALLFFPISRNYPFSKVNLKKVVESHLSETEKLNVLMYYILNNHNSYDGNFKNKEALDANLNLLKQLDLNNIFTLDYLKSLGICCDKYFIIFEILELFENNTNKEQIFEYIIQQTETRVINSSSSIHDLFLTNLYGNILKGSNNRDFLCTAEKMYKETVNFLYRPYINFRNPDSYEVNVKKLFYYGIALFIFYFPNVEKCNKIIQQFNDFAKKGFPAYLNSDLNNIIIQLKNQLESQSSD